MDESTLKEIVRASLAPHFLLREEVKGSWLVDGTSVIIDFLLYPKPHILRMGFDPVAVGCEVKSPDTVEPWKKGKRLAWQALTYAQSTFDGIRPAFVVTYPPLEEFFVSERSEHDNELQGAAGHALSSFLQYANVGSLILEESNWEIRFGSQRYFSKKRGKGKIKNLGTKRIVGSF